MNVIDTRTKRLWWAAVCVAVIAVAVVALVRVVVRDEGYGPIDAGGGFGLDGPGVVRSQRDGGEWVRLGSGAAYSYSQLENAGSHAVRIAAIEHEGPVEGASWAPAARADEMVFGPKSWRTFPAVIPAHGSIQVRVSVGRPASCGGRAPHYGGGLVYTGDYRVRWQSRRSMHVTRITGPLDGGKALQLC